MIKKPVPEKTPVNILQQDPESVLAFIQNKVQQLTKLNQIWQVEIPIELSEHTRVANFREGYLTHIEWNIQPLFHAQNTQLSQLPPTLSSASAELLKNAADAIPVKSLQEALLRIAQHKN
jgi:hypothetical protein